MIIETALQRKDLIQDPQALSGLNFSLPRQSPEKGVSPDNTTVFADILYSRTGFLKKEVHAWQKAFEGQIVVDLGSGRAPYGYLIACIAKAKAYIGVDDNNASSLRFNLSPERLQGFASRHGEPRPLPEPLIPAWTFQDDMLTFLRRIEEPSVSILATGLHFLLDGDYSDLVTREVERVLDPKGSCVTYSSMDDPLGGLKLPYEELGVAIRWFHPNT